MAAPRKADGEKHSNRWISFSPEDSAYLDSLPVGQKSRAIHEALAGYPDFQRWKAPKETVRKD